MMKTSHIHILFGFALILGLLSCVKEREIESSEPSSEDYYAEMCFKAGIVDSSTKTTRTESGSVIWSAEEEINVFKGSSISGRFTSQNQEPAKTVTFTGALSGTFAEGEDSYWAIYPYSSGNRCDGDGVTLSLPSVQTSNEGTFNDGIFPSVAHSSDNDLFFYNICGGFKISLSRGDIKEITLEGNNKESLAGKVYLSGAVGERPSLLVKEGISKISLTPSSGKYFKEGAYYYFTVLPAELSSGFTMSFKTEDRIGVLKTGNPLTISHSVFCSKDNIDSYVTEWAEYSQKNKYANSGVYLGIMAFNQSITKNPISLVTTENRDSFTDFIKNLTTANGTLLYYGVDNSITALQGEEYPEDIDNVAIVTFTDGLDQGSLMMGSDYMSDEEYLEALKAKLSSERVSGLPITAYSVGVMGSDVSDQTQFRKNLNALASKPENVYELTNISELQNIFEEIAGGLSVSTDYSYNIALSIPGLSDGTRVRFTFDKEENASNSQKYIEGIFNLRYHSLDEVTYVGLTSLNGDTVTGSVEDDIFVKFTFNALRNGDGGEMSTDSIAEWYWSSGDWQKNTEFDRDTNSNVGMEVKTKSAAIYLVLDCSSSLGNDFKTMKSAANKFVDKLYAVEHRPQSVRLNRQKLNMAVDDEVQLSASVFPVTALVESYSWSTSNSSVATVTENGLVTAIAPGEATVTCTTVKAGCSIGASCSIVVSKDFDINEEWGPANPDFTYTGLYFGMLAYNKDTYKYKICRLDDATKADILTFIDDITIQNGTVMCSATDEALTELLKPEFPDDLSKVTLISFTDGLDQGSVMKNDIFSSTDAYLDYLNEKILTEKVQSVSINAYSIGIQGTDLVAHNNSLNKLASSSSNVFSLKNQTSIYSTLKDIANSADVSVNVLTYNAYDLTITIPGLSNGSKVRFTFDNINDANESRLFIEGTFNLKDRSLNDISFFGFESSMPSTIAGVVDGIFVSFTFTDIVKSDKSNLSLTSIKEWTRSSSATTWQINSEFNTSDVVATSQTKKTVNQNSALLYLVLDYSSSIASDYDVMKSSIKSFVRSLALKFVGSIKFSQESLLLYAGGAGKIIAQVLPETAVVKDLRWTSSNESIAMVDGSGNVSAVSPGQCVITATSNNGVSASCRVVVSNPPTSVDLGLSVKWSPFNIGATEPDECGGFYQWAGLTDVSDSSINLNSDNCPYFDNGGWTKYGSDHVFDLASSDDIASLMLGGTWRMPTMEDFTELHSKCKMTWTDDYNNTGIAGCIFTSNVEGYTEYSIFLPAAGYRDGRTQICDLKGHYWTSSIYGDKNRIYDRAYSMIIELCRGSIGGGNEPLIYYYPSMSTGHTARYQGLSVRPVCE